MVRRAVSTMGCDGRGEAVTCAGHRL